MRKAVSATARNKSQRSELRTAVKKARAAAGSDQGKTAFLEAEKMLDRSGRKGLIHRNTAARYKSRMAKKLKG